MSTQDMRRFVIFLGLLVLAIGGVFAAGSLNQKDIALSNFTHLSAENGGGIGVKIEQSKISFTSSTLVSTTVDDLFAADDIEISASYDSELFRGPNQISWHYPKELENSIQAQRYFLVLKPSICKFIPKSLGHKLFESCAKPKYIELVRQSPEFLENIGIVKPDGYTIAGRTNLTFLEGVKLPKVRGKQYKSKNILPNYQLPQSVIEELDTDNAVVLEAVRLANVFYSNSIRIGTAGVSNAEFTALPIQSRLDKVWSGESAFQCAGMRDMWLEMAGYSTIIPKARHVGAYNYYPLFKDLVPFSHAIAEFYVPEWDKWVGIDPWYGFMYKLDGVFLSTYELTQLNEIEKQRMEMTAIVELVQQYTQSLGGERMYSSLPAKKVVPPLSSTWKNGTYTMGYLDYFNTVDFGPEITTAPLESSAVQ